MNLSEEQMSLLIELYYDGEPEEELINAFELDLENQSLISIFPEIIHAESCPYCFEHYQQARGNRDNSSLFTSEYPISCPRCNHRMTDECICANCCESIQITEDKEQVIRNYCISEINMLIPSVRALDIKQSIYLLGLLRSGTDDDLNLITPIKNHPLAFSPHEVYSLNIIRELCTNNLISPAPNSKAQAFTVTSGCVENYQFDAVYWVTGYRFLGIDFKQLMLELETHIEHLIAQPDGISNLGKFWSELALNEVLSYLSHILNKHRFPFTPGNKIELIINQMLEKYSVSQSFNFCWSVTQSAASNYLIRGLSTDQVSRTIIGRLQQRFDRAVSENWEIKGYRRDYNLPASVLTSLFSTKITNLNERYLSLPPGVSNL